MKNLYYILIFMLLPISIYGQYIEGRVLDASTGKPIKNVHIYIDNVEEGIQSFQNGKYYLKFSEIVSEGAKIRFSHVSFTALEVDFNESQHVYNVSLTPKVHRLNEVQLSQNRHLKKQLPYEKLKGMPNRLHAFGTVLVDDKIYVSGGNASFQYEGLKQSLRKFENLELSQLSLDHFLKYAYNNFEATFFKGDLQVYDIKTNTWERQKDVFKKRAQHNMYCYQDKLYVLGGINLSKNKTKEYLDSSIEIFDLDSGEISVDETNPHQAVNFSSFVYEDAIVVLGGSTKLKKNGKKEYTKEAHLYNPLDGYWYQLKDMPTAKETKGILVDDSYYLIGGYNDKPLSGIEVFDVKSQEWRQLGDLFFGISNPALAFHENTIYIYNNGKFCTLNTVTKELNEYFINIQIQNSEMHIVDTTIYLFGGLNSNYDEIEPSSRMYSIDLKDFDTTQIRRSKILQ